MEVLFAGFVPVPEALLLLIAVLSVGDPESLVYNRDGFDRIEWQESEHFLTEVSIDLFNLLKSEFVELFRV